MVLLSIIMSRLSMGLFIFPIPVLLAVNGVKDTRKAVLVHLASTVGVVGTYVVSNSVLFTQEYMTVAFLGLVFPLTISLAALIWTALRDFSNSVLRKLVICSIPSALIALCFALWLCSNASIESVNNMKTAYSMILPQELVGEGSSAIMDLFFVILKYACVPFAILLQALPILISEFIIHRGDEEWNFEFANMKMPYPFVWVFLALLALSVIIPRINGIPEVVSVVLWNLTFGMALHYILDGISVLFSVLRRKTLRITPSTVVLWVAVSTIIPYLNMFVYGTLLITGVFENWINLR